MTEDTGAHVAALGGSGLRDRAARGRVLAGTEQGSRAPETRAERERMERPRARRLAKWERETTSYTRFKNLLELRVVDFEPCFYYFQHMVN